MLDTKNFVMRTGVRTFEAAAYLRKIGADTVQVKSLFSNTISMYSMRAQIVAHAELYRNNAISAVKLQDKNARVLAAQAADELLSIQGCIGTLTADMLAISCLRHRWGQKNRRTASRLRT